MKKKHLLMGLICACALFAVPAYAYGPALDNPYATETGIPLTVHIDGSYVSTDVDPYSDGGRTYLPLRAATESMGAEVVWNQANRTATITKDGTTIACTLGSTTMRVNGVPQRVDAAPQARNGRTMLPIRPIAEALGARLDYDAHTASVFIDTPAADAPAPVIPDYVPENVRWLVEKYYIPTIDRYYTGSFYSHCDLEDIRAAVRYTDNFLFISEMPSGKLNAVMVGYTTYGNRESIGVDSMELTSKDNGILLKDDWSPHYWHGSSIGAGSGYFIADYWAMNFSYTHDLWLIQSELYSDSGKFIEQTYVDQGFDRF